MLLIMDCGRLQQHSIISKQVNGYIIEQITDCKQYNDLNLQYIFGEYCFNIRCFQLYVNHRKWLQSLYQNLIESELKLIDKLSQQVFSIFYKSVHIYECKCYTY